ncbi:hypothetical protein NPIL_496241 [Nephila pilipes]|uniref:Uncharacterized protein n=1 Tax=Nephila pilipes TaxID=299642 RepID=A0A8X6PR18_NEPPI|nr:hypothetical protein NPIL_496241 [Nephila pilipes]
MMERQKNNLRKKDEESSDSAKEEEKSARGNKDVKVKEENLVKMKKEPDVKTVLIRASTLSAEIEETRGESVEQAQPKSSHMSSDTESENLEDEFRPNSDPRFCVQLLFQKEQSYLHCVP